MLEKNANDFSAVKSKIELARESMAQLNTSETSLQKVLPTGYSGRMWHSGIHPDFSLSVLNK